MSKKVQCSSSPDLWFSEEDYEKVVAKSICESCPVKDMCYNLAVKNDERYGIWGGVDFEGSKLTDKRKNYGTCRKGLHELADGVSNCTECRRISQKAYERRKATNRAKAAKPKVRKKNIIGQPCKNGHQLTKENTSVRKFDGALLCAQCLRRVRPTGKSGKF